MWIRRAVENKRLQRLYGSVAAIIALGGSSAKAVPPPPPSQADLASLQNYISGLDKGRPDLYESALAEDINVAIADKPVAESKSQWISSAGAHFQAGGNQNVTVEQVFYGYAKSPTNGNLEPTAILLERAVRILGDCCVYNRTETLVFHSGLVSSIRRSVELDLLLKSDGHRQDE
jgi:hypothetical protein